MTMKLTGQKKWKRIEWYLVLLCYLSSRLYALRKTRKLQFSPKRLRNAALSSWLPQSWLKSFLKKHSHFYFSFSFFSSWMPWKIHEYLVKTEGHRNKIVTSERISTHCAPRLEFSFISHSVCSSLMQSCNLMQSFLLQEQLEE